MLIAEGIGIGGFVLATISFMYKMTVDVAEIKKQVTNDIKHIDETDNIKHSRIYERLDEHKKLSDIKFVEKDMCNILHKQTAEDIAEIKNDVKTLLRDKFQGRDGLKGERGERGEAGKDK
jgi:hypothetical protein